FGDLRGARMRLRRKVPRQREVSTRHRFCVIDSPDRSAVSSVPGGNMRSMKPFVIAVVICYFGWPIEGQQWWSGAVDLGGVDLGSGPAVVVSGLHNMDVFYMGPNGHLWT